MTPSVRFALICDDCRREDNGKLILIGVYARDIRVLSFPATLALTLVIGLDADVPGEGDVEFRTVTNGRISPVITGHIKFGSAGMSIFNIPPQVLSFDTNSELWFQWRFGNRQEWETLISIPILLGMAPTVSNEPAQPS